ncbi:MAG: GHKL domain-containing protein [Bacteroidota bacterium]|nr:GHKL domain-containing protein [Bacteroidota bacterium]
MPYLILKNKYKVRPLRIIFIFYWFLLAYILAALIFWFIDLNEQNKELTQLRLNAVNVHDTYYIQKINRIENEEKRKTAQYIGEGVTFLLMIIAGAVYVFRIIKRQLVQSEQQKNFMMAISHELKTPIAVTKLNLETMQIRKLEFGQQQKLIRSTIQEANRLNTLCNNMLFMSQLDSEGSSLTNEKIDLSTLAIDCAEDFILRFPERKIEIDVENDIIFTGDKLLLQLAINNLLDNAIKYSGKEDVVLIKVFKEPKKIKLQVIDQGSGVEPAEKERIFEKYFRGASKQTKGTGLGLYLTREIVKQHRGSISMKNNKPRGSIFEIQIRSSKNI